MTGGDAAKDMYRTLVRYAILGAGCDQLFVLRTNEAKDSCRQPDASYPCLVSFPALKKGVLSHHGVEQSLVNNPAVESGCSALQDMVVRIRSWASTRVGSHPATTL